MCKKLTMVFFQQNLIPVRSKAITLLLSFIIFVNCIAQTDDDNAPISKTRKGFHMGLMAGTLFANKYTANLYDGYGYDFNSNKNDFANSWIYRKIVIEYGGGNGTPDRITPAAGYVNRSDWTFTQTDMPIELKYNIALALGFHSRYCFNNKDAIVLNVNATKLTINGSFTLTSTVPPFGNTPPGWVSLKTFSILGVEQRLMFQMGYQRILGDEDNPLNCFIEGGAVITMVKFYKNQILINSLQIDLPTQYNNVGYITYQAKNLTGVGFGAFAGFGINMNASAKWTLQLVYNPSYENINIGPNPKLTLQHVVGFRGYYNL